MKTTKTTQTATNKDLSAGLAEIMGNHGNDEHRGNLGCKPRGPQTTGLEIPEKFPQKGNSKRTERTWAIPIWIVLREPKFRTEFPYFSRDKRPEFRRKRDLCDPLQPLCPKFFPIKKIQAIFKEIRCKVLRVPSGVSFGHFWRLEVLLWRYFSQVHRAVRGQCDSPELIGHHSLFTVHKRMFH